MKKRVYFMTVALLCKPGGVYLGRKTKKIGAGLYNGPGGTIEDGETIDEATLRGLFEETGVRAEAKHLRKAAVVNCYNKQPDGTVQNCRLFVSRLIHWDGIPKDSGEMRNITLFPRSQLPLREMLPGDAFWLPQALVGQPIATSVHYLPGMKALDKTKEFRIKILSSAEINGLWVTP